jgi:hypothetical protein
MPLPAFTAKGLLPDGVHPATEAELKDRCVDPFPGSKTRADIFAGFVRYRQAVAGFGLNVTQWVDGSFVDSTRVNPEDVDVVNFAHATEVNNLPPAMRVGVTNTLLNAKESTQPVYSTHTFLEIRFPTGHVFAAGAEAQRIYWRRWFATPQDYSHYSVKRPAPQRGRKGIVQMTIGNPTLAPAIAA